MKAWIMKDFVVAGSVPRKIDVILIPRPKECSLIIGARDGKVVWIDELDRQPKPEDGLRNIEIEDTLAKTVISGFDAGYLPSPDTENSLVELIKKYLT
jgi:hypothetical protein